MIYGYVFQCQAWDIATLKKTEKYLNMSNRYPPNSQSNIEKVGTG